MQAEDAYSMHERAEGCFWSQGPFAGTAVVSGGIKALLFAPPR